MGSFTVCMYVADHCRILCVGHRLLQVTLHYDIEKTGCYIDQFGADAVLYRAFSLKNEVDSFSLFEPGVFKQLLILCNIVLCSTSLKHFCKLHFLTNLITDAFIPCNDVRIVHSFTNYTFINNIIITN
jgi:hypothetical protein